MGHGGRSLWVTAIKIVVQLGDGTTAEFFKTVGDAFTPLSPALSRYDWALLTANVQTREPSAHWGWDHETGIRSRDGPLPSHTPPRPGARRMGDLSQQPRRSFLPVRVVDMDDELPSSTAWAAAV